MNSNPGPQALIPTVNNSSSMTNSIDIVDSINGSNRDDILTLLKPTDGQHYQVDGAGGYDIFALKEILSEDVTRNGNQLNIVSPTFQFTVELTNVERVSFGDRDILTGDPLSLGRAGDFDVFVAENMTAENTDVEGRIAIGGDGNFTHLGFGTRLEASDAASRETLILGGDLNFTHGSVNGKAVVGGNMGVTEHAYLGGKFNVEESPVNFDAAHKHLIDVSNSVGNLNANSPTNISSWGAITMDATGATGTTVFDLPEAALENATSWDITANPGSTVIINVTGEDLFVTNFQMSLNGQPLQSGSTAPFNVLLNFQDTTKLESTAFSWQGTVLAPLADVTFHNGHINGQMYVKSIAGTGEHHLVPMDFDLPPIQVTTQTVFAIVDTGEGSESGSGSANDEANELAKLVGCHDVFVISDFNAEATGIAGSAAVGGNAEFLYVGIGTGVEEWINEDALTVGGDLTFHEGRSHGPVAVGGNAIGIVGAEVSNDTPIDFSQAAADLVAYSDSLHALDSTNTIEITPWNSIHLDGSNSPGETSVFNLNGSDLEQAALLTIDGDEGGQIVVNVSGDNLNIENLAMHLNGQALQEGDDSPFEVLFNFAEATTVSTSHIAWLGSVLSPRADWQFQNARIVGQLAVHSLSSLNAAFYMNGCDHRDETTGGAVTPPDQGGGTEGTGTNAAPIATDDSFQVCNHETVAGNLSLNDTDVDEDELVYSLIQKAQHGTVRVNLDGEFKYEADLGFVGTDTFHYLANDENGGTDEAIITIEVLDCTPPEVDLEITKSMTNVTAGVRWSRHGNSDEIAYPYDVVEYSVTVRNVSDFKATGIVVQDITPENIDVWKSGDSLTYSEAGRRWDNNYWVGQVHTLDGFEESPKYVDPTNGSVDILESGTATKGKTLAPGKDYDLNTGLVTWKLGTELQGGESVTLKYYGMREVYSAYNWSFGTQFRTEAAITALDQVDSNPSNDSTTARSWWVSPIALDLNGDNHIGVTGDSTTISHSYTGGRLVDFDIDADGELDQIEWFSGDGDGILIDTSKVHLDRRIDGSALFGDQGGRFSHGYEKLGLLDQDNDQTLRDQELASLALWLDDGDALIEDGELKSLDEYGIAVLSVAMELDEIGRMRSTAERADGSTIMTEDVWFARPN